MAEVKIVGRGVDTLVLNVSYADKQFQPIKQELDADLQEELNSLQGEARINESAVVTNWAFKGFNLFMKERGSRGQLMLVRSGKKKALFFPVFMVGLLILEMSSSNLSTCWKRSVCLICDFMICVIARRLSSL